MEIGVTKIVKDRIKTTQIEEIRGDDLVFVSVSHITHIL